MIRRLFRCTGTVRSTEHRNSSCAMDIVLHDMRDEFKAPVAIKAYGELATYINDLSWTDAEERYLAKHWYYDENLMLHYIEIQSASGIRPAKIIAVKDAFADESFTIFGAQDLIEEAKPEPMSNEEYSRWIEFRNGSEYRFLEETGDVMKREFLAIVQA